MIELIYGNNFSGRSRHLKNIVGWSDYLQSTSERGKTCDADPSIYLEPIPESSISGLFDSVEEEVFRFHATRSASSSIRAFVTDLGIDYLLKRNPFVLSGGEKVLTVFLSAVTQQPKAIAVDSLLEQLSSEWRSRVISFLPYSGIEQFYLADNRASEFATSSMTGHSLNSALDAEHGELALESLDSTQFCVPKLESPPLLELVDMRFAYQRGQDVLHGGRLQLQGGQVYRLRGRNGSGKSTLAKVLSGVLNLNSGRILMDGTEISPYRHPGRFVGYSFQQPDDQLFLGHVESEVSSRHYPQSDEVRRSILRSFGLQHTSSVHPMDLPLTVRKRLSVASTLAADRPFYVLDEPTLYQDDHNMLELARIIQRIADTGRGVILISHAESFISLIDGIEEISIEDGFLSKRN